LIKIAIIGAGGHTRSSTNILIKTFNDTKFEIYDNSYISGNYEHINNIKIVGKIDDIDSTSQVFLSIGNNNLRKFYFEEFYAQLIKVNIYHQTSIIENNISFGISNQIFANSYINAFSIIGDDNIINSGSILEHEVMIGSHNHISVGAELCGRVRVGDRCMIGAGAIVIDNVSICDNVIIGAGAVVIKDIIEAGTYVGIPAKKIK